MQPELRPVPNNDSAFGGGTPRYAPGDRIVDTVDSQKVLRNTYLLLALTMVPTIVGAFVGMSTVGLVMQHPIMISLVMLAGVIGLQFAIAANRNSGLGVALLLLGDRTASLVTIIDQAGQALFVVVGIIMRAAPLGAFGAMAFTVGRYGVGTLLSLGKLMAAVYLTCFLFVVVVLGAVLRIVGLGLVRFVRYLADEILIVIGTSSSESALPRLMAKMEHLGCSKPVVGLVVPAGYSFNLDGTAIYMTMAAVFVAQASGVHLSAREQISVLAVLMLTSKGAAGVTGSGFITLAATLSAVPAIPSAGLALLVGVDRFMSEVRAVTNLIGNAVATVAIGPDAVLVGPVPAAES